VRGDSEKARQVPGVVGHVRVHRDDSTDIALCETPRKTVPDRRTNPLLGTPVQDGDRETLIMQPFGKLSGPIGASVVDDENSERLSSHRPLDRMEKRFQVRSFIERRYDNVSGSDLVGIVNEGLACDGRRGPSREAIEVTRV